MLSTTYPDNINKRHISSGGIEFLKLVGVLFMAIDHVNKYLLEDTVKEFFYAGRIALPLFCIVLGYNLANTTHLTDTGIRMIRKMVLFGTISEIPFILLNQDINGLAYGWYPLNVFFLLASSTAFIILLGDGLFKNIAALFVFIICGAMVEFWWVGLAISAFSFAFFRHSKIIYCLLTVVSVASLYFINGNSYAMLVFPLLFIPTIYEFKVKRLGMFYYWFYPTHLLLILAAHIYFN